MRLGSLGDFGDHGSMNGGLRGHFHLDEQL